MFLKRAFRFKAAKICQQFLGRAQKATATQCAIHDVSQDDANGLLNINWTDGTKGKFPYVWLRDNSPDPETYNLTERCRARILLMKDLDLQVKPENAKIAPNGQTVTVKWPFGLQSNFDSDWLRNRNLDDPEFRAQRNAYYLEDYECWDNEKIQKLIREPVDFDLLMTDNLYLAKQLMTFLRFGFLRVSNVPDSEFELAKVEKRLGFLTTTHYGGRFTVKSFVDPANLAYTTKELGLHMDLPSCERPPDMQILHCVRQAGSGGENQFVDGFNVAEQLKVEHPEVFQILVSVPVEYIDAGCDEFPYQMAYRWPVIQADMTGKFKGIFFNNAVRSWFYNASAEEISKIYEAMKIFYEYCYQPRNLLQLRLQPGEMVWFANNRTLHGRSAFMPEGGSGERHYEGAYVGFDAVRSTIRVILEKENKHAHLAI